MQRGDILFWISHKLKNISFKPAIGFEKINVDTYTEMWELIYTYVDSGYRVR